MVHFVSFALRPLLLALLLSGFLASASQTAATQNGCQPFPETGHQVCGRFLEYWQSNGGLMQQGYPISDQVQEKSDTDGKVYTMQYFERAVFELHPENHKPYDVLLSLLGEMLYNVKYPGGAPGQQPNNSAGALSFEQTGHRLGGVFLDYWNAHGGLAQQGYPISDEFQEQSRLDSNTYKVQYFERAVFEWHPKNNPPYDVLLSQLGTFRYQDKPHNGAEVYPGRIVFDQPAQSEVVLINTDGTGRKVIASGRSPVFAPDGSRVAYLAPVSSQGMGKVAIRASGLGPSNAEDLCTTDGNAQLDLIRWSPRNRYIAMNAGQNPPGQVYLCGLDTKALTPQRTNQGVVTTVWDWTPDGDSAVWQAGSPPDSLDLYYGDPTPSGGVFKLTNQQNQLDQFGLKYYTSARFSPNGKSIAIAGSNIFLLPVPGEGATVKPQTFSMFGQPSSLAWSPDGRALAVVDRANNTLSILDIASGKVTKIADNVGAADWSRQ